MTINRAENYARVFSADTGLLLHLLIRNSIALWPGNRGPK